VISAVTADQTVAVAVSSAPTLAGCLVPRFQLGLAGRQDRAAGLIDAAGGRYVEGAVMTSVPPYRIRVPLLLGGRGCRRTGAAAQRLGFAAKVASERLGVASATKMCRSVMIKGLEAMVIESFTAARAHGVEDAVIASLYETFPGIDWEKQGSLFLPARDRARPPPRRGSARSGADGARGGAGRPGPRWARPSARPGWPTSPTPALFGRRDAARLRPQRRLAYRSRPHPWRDHEGFKGHEMNSKRPRLARLVRRSVSADFQVPPGSVDAHCHVFGPGAEFPFAPERKYTPCDASKQQLFALRDHLGFARNVDRAGHLPRRRQPRHGRRLSQHSAARRAAWRRSAQRQRRELQAMHAAGVRGVRFNFVKRLVDFTPKDELMEIAARIKTLGWHVVIYFEAVDLPELWDFFTALPTTVVVDHMGRPDVSKPVDGPEFGLFLKFMREHPNVWSKVSCPERLSLGGPKALNGEQAAYRDVVPFARIVESFPDRVLWGTDWPHPNLKDHMPDDGLLVDFIPHIATTPSCSANCWSTIRCALYWPEES
jgi:2-pyrone-4,6-dicarboxylate lactonase